MGYKRLLELYGASHGEVLKEEEEAKAKGGNEPACGLSPPLPPGALYIGAQGTSEGTRRQEALFTYTVADMTTGVLSHCS